jgi:hypothetical protein
VYEQIARNKRRTVLYIGVFFLVWLDIGAVVGTLYDAFSPGPVGAPSLEPRDLIVGIILAAVLAAAATAFTLRSGTRLVLSVAGARPAERAAYPQLYDQVELSRSVTDCRLRASTSSGIPRPTRSPRV